MSTESETGSSNTFYEIWKQHFFSKAVQSVEWTMSKAGYTQNPLSKLRGYQHLGGRYPIINWQHIQNVRTFNPNLGFIVAVWNQPQKKYLIATACIFGKSKTRGITSAHALMNQQGQYPDSLHFWSAPDSDWVADPIPSQLESNKSKIASFAEHHKYEGDGSYAVPPEYIKFRNEGSSNWTTRTWSKIMNQVERYDVGIFRLKKPVSEATALVTFANVQHVRPRSIGIHGYPLNCNKYNNYPPDLYGNFGQLLVPNNRSWDRDWESGAITVRAWSGMSGSPLFVADRNGNGNKKGNDDRLVIVGVFFGTNIKERDGDWSHSEYTATLICNGVAKFLDKECGEEIDWVSLDDGGPMQCVYNQSKGKSNRDYGDSDTERVSLLVEKKNDVDSTTKRLNGYRELSEQEC